MKEKCNDKIPNLLDDDEEFEHSDMEAQLFSNNSVHGGYDSHYNNKENRCLDTDESVFDIKHESHFDIISKNLTLNSPRSYMTADPVIKNLHVVKKIKKHNLHSPTKLSKSKTLTHTTAVISNKQILKPNQNNANIRVKYQAKRTTLSIFEVGVKRKLDSLASFDKPRKKNFTLQPKLLALSRAKKVRPQKIAYCVPIKRQNNGGLIISKAQELLGLLNGIEKLECQDFKTEKDLLEKCALMIRHKLQ